MKKRLAVSIALMIGFTTLCGGFISKGLEETITSSVRATSDPVSMMPNANFVAVIDIQQVFASRLFTSIMKDPKTASEFQKFEVEAAKNGFDIRQMNHLAIGGNMAAGGKTESFFGLLSGSFDREKIMSSMAASDKVTIKSETYGDSTIYLLRPKNQKEPVNDLKEIANFNFNTDEMAFTFLAQDTVFFGTIDSVKNALDIRAGKQSGLMGNSEMLTYISRATPSALLRFAFKLPPKEAAKGKTLSNDDISSEGQSVNASAQQANDPFGMNKMVESIEAGYGSLELSSGFIMDTNLVIKSEPEAKQMAEGLNGLLALGKMMGAGQINDKKQAKLLNDVLSSISITGAGRDVKVALNFSEALVNDIAAMIEAEAKKAAPKAAK